MNNQESHPDSRATGAPPVDATLADVVPDQCTCLICGYRSNTLKNHILRDHGLRPNEYRAR